MCGRDFYDLAAMAGRVIQTDDVRHDCFPLPCSCWRRFVIVCDEFPYASDLMY
jgi:hypothetical protein